MKFAWIENDKIRDVCTGIPAECYTEEVANHYTQEVPDNAENGDGWVNAQLVKPEPMPVLPPIEIPRTWGVQNVRDGLTLNERVKWDNDASDFIKTAKIEFAQEQKIEHASEVLSMLVKSGDISQSSMEKILS